MANDTVNFTIKKTYISGVTTTAKILAYTGGLYSFAFLMLPAVLGSGQAHDPYYDYQKHAVERSTTNHSDWGDSGWVAPGSPGRTQDTSVDTVKSRVDDLFPELNGNVSLEPLGASGLVQVDSNDHELTFLMTHDGNYLFTDAYFDLSMVRTSDDAGNMRAVELSPRNSEFTETHASTSTQAEPDVDEQLFRQEAFKWAMDNAQIKYPSTVDEAIGDIVVFADYTCPECKTFHNNYSQLQDQGYNLHIALLSRRGNSGQVFENTKAIQCSTNPKGNYELAIQTNHVSLPRPGPDCEPYAGDFFDMATHFMSKEMDNPGTPGIWVNGERFVNRIEALRL